MTRREDDALLGAVGLNRVVERHRRAELGYWQGLRHRGQGYATEAATGLLDQAFGRAGLQRVWAMTFAGNTPSERVLGRLAFTREGHLRRDVKHRGRYADLIIWGLLREEWRHHRA